MAQPKRVKITEQAPTGDHSDSARPLVKIMKQPPAIHEMPKGEAIEMERKTRNG